MVQWQCRESQGSCATENASKGYRAYPHFLVPGNMVCGRERGSNLYIKVVCGRGGTWQCKKLTSYKRYIIMVPVSLAAKLSNPTPPCYIPSRAPSESCALSHPIKVILPHPNPILPHPILICHVGEKPALPGRTLHCQLLQHVYTTYMQTQHWV